MPQSCVDKPVLLLTCGDPAGIGPEVVAKAWAATAVHDAARLRVIADAAMIAQVLADRPGLPRLEVEAVSVTDPRSSADRKSVV